MLDVVKGLDAKVQDQDARLQKQEERVSIANISALPSAHSSPKKATDQPGLGFTKGLKFRQFFCLDKS